MGKEATIFTLGPSAKNETRIGAVLSWLAADGDDVVTLNNDLASNWRQNNLETVHTEQQSRCDLGDLPGKLS